MNVRTLTLQKSLFEYIVYSNIEHHDVGWLLFPVEFLLLQELINNQIKKIKGKTIQKPRASIKQAYAFHVSLSLIAIYIYKTNDLITEAY